MSEAQIIICMKRFTRAIVGCFEEQWLRRPTKEEIESMAARNQLLGSPGCIGEVDCAVWERDNCPVGLQGNYEGKGKIRLSNGGGMR